MWPQWNSNIFLHSTALTSSFFHRNSTAEKKRMKVNSLLYTTSEYTMRKNYTHTILRNIRSWKSSFRIRREDAMFHSFVRILGESFSKVIFFYYGVLWSFCFATVTVRMRINIMYTIHKQEWDSQLMRKK